MAHQIELEQRRLQEELPMDATVLDVVVKLLNLDPEEAEGLVGRQLVEADREAPKFVKYTGNVRRAGVGCGFMAGVLFTLAAQRAQRDAHPWPECPTCGRRAVEANVPAVHDQLHPLGSYRAAPHPDGPVFSCPEGHTFRAGDHGG